MWHNVLRIQSCLQWLGLLPRCGFDPWPGIFRMSWVEPKNKEKRKKKSNDIEVNRSALFREDFGFTEICVSLLSNHTTSK